MSRLRALAALSALGASAALPAAPTASAAAPLTTAAIGPAASATLPPPAVPSGTQEAAPPALPPEAALARRYRVAAIATSKTSIYIGSVTLNVDPLILTDGAYRSKYAATVFPYFFYNERGTLAIAMPPASLLRVSRGEPVEFTGRAASEDGEERRISGKATPSDATHGKIKVRIYVSKRIALIFNTTYEIRP